MGARKGAESGGKGGSEKGSGSVGEWGAGNWSVDVSFPNMTSV